MYYHKHLIILEINNISLVIIILTISLFSCYLTRFDQSINLVNKFKSLVSTFMKITLSNQILINLVYKAWQRKKILILLSRNATEIGDPTIHIFQLNIITYYIFSLIIINPEKLKICSYKYGH